MESLANLILALKEHGVVRAYFKLLSPNDNSKNQIYLGGNFTALQMIPHGLVTLDERKIGGSEGRQRFKCDVVFDWLLSDGTLSPAPDAKLILYPRYPEVRLSGLLQGARGAPSELVRSREAGRALVIGITQRGRVIAHAVWASHPIANGLREIWREDSPVLAELPIVAAGQSGRDLLLAEFRRIHRKGWIDSKRLRGNGELGPCDSPNCGGYTLEAELGVRPNGEAQPDFHGWEVKQFSVRSFDKPGGVLTLMTPEPDGGFYASAGVAKFVRKFGRPDAAGRSDRLNFGGVHRVVGVSARTGLSLKLPGYDADNGVITDMNGAVSLVAATGEVAASWSFVKLLAHWRIKHERAAYAASQVEALPARRYRYGPTVYLGTGADFLTLLRSLAQGHVYYDPGIKLENASTNEPKTKRRSQFRIQFREISALYRGFEAVSVS